MPEKEKAVKWLEIEDYILRYLAFYDIPKAYSKSLVDDIQDDLNSIISERQEKIKLSKDSENLN